MTAEAPNGFEDIDTLERHSKISIIFWFDPVVKVQECPNFMIPGLKRYRAADDILPPFRPILGFKTSKKSWKSRGRLIQDFDNPKANVRAICILFYSFLGYS